MGQSTVGKALRQRQAIIPHFYLISNTVLCALPTPEPPFLFVYTSRVVSLTPSLSLSLSYLFYLPSTFTLSLSHFRPSLPFSICTRLSLSLSRPVLPYLPSPFFSLSALLCLSYPLNQYLYLYIYFVLYLSHRHAPPHPFSTFTVF